MQIVGGSRVVSSKGCVAYECIDYDNPSIWRISSWVLVGGKKQAIYDNIGTLVFSPDGEHLAYAAKLGEKGFIILDGEEQKMQFEAVGDPVFSPNGKHIFYKAKIGKEWTVVVDNNTKGERYDSITTKIIITPKPDDSCIFSYVCNYGRSKHTKTVVEQMKDGHRTTVDK